MKKIGYFFMGLFSAILSACSVIFVMNKTMQPTTEINGKIKAKNGGIASLDIKSKSEIRRSKRKLKKSLK